MEFIVTLAVSLIKDMSVVIMVAYVVTRSRSFSEILEGKFTFRNRGFMIVIFGLFSIFGTLSGIQIKDAVANIRDLGPAIAGLIAGPVVGFGAGLIGALHRYSMGGITCFACSLSTLVAGCLGGIIYHFNKGKFIGVFWAILFMAFVEALHMALNLVLSTPYDVVRDIVASVSVPMILANSMGMAIFAFIVTNLIRERRTRAEKEMMEGELRVAHDIQMGIVPRVYPAFPGRKEFDVYGFMKPARQVGGDFYDYFLLGDGRLCFVIGDVSGKGVPAALFMAMTKTLIKADAGRLRSPDEILFSVNNETGKDNESYMFITVFIGILDCRTGVVEYGNAGHNLPYVMRVDGRVEQLPRTGGVAIGALESVRYTKNRLTLGAGDCLVLFTDGIPEAMDRRGDLFSESRLEGLLRTATDTTPMGIRTIILDGVHSFAGETEQSDDMTLLIVKYFGAGSSHAHPDTAPGQTPAI